MASHVLCAMVLKRHPKNPVACLTFLKGAYDSLLPLYFLIFLAKSGHADLAFKTTSRTWSQLFHLSNPFLVQFCFLGYTPRIRSDFSRHYCVTLFLYSKVKFEL